MTESHPRTRLQRRLHLLSFLAGIAILAAVTAEILTGDRTRFPEWYLVTQFVVCVIFLADFFVRCGSGRRQRHFFVRSLPYLLLSIPYLALLEWSGVHLSRPWAMALGTVPLWRTFLALYIIIHALIRSRAKMLAVAYVLTVILFTYISGLIFYDFESGVNPHLHGLGNAVWWAWMGVTTVGAAIFPVTVAGKIFAVLLPILGMMMFPIFTIYVTEIYTRRYKKEGRPNP